MTVQELGILHRRYVDLSDRFRAAWAYHQFVESLNKMLPEGEHLESPSNFQDVYTELKDISQHLSAANVLAVRGRLDRVDQQLVQLTQALLAEDSRITPASLRQFFVRVKNPNSTILAQLVKFYLYSYQGTGWDPDRVDKVDYLLTRIASEDRGPEGFTITSTANPVRELLKGLWHLSGSEPPSEETVAARKEDIEALRAEVVATEDLDELNHRRSVHRYREIKHSLGMLFFHPDVLAIILETNLTLRDRIQALYRQEEQRLFSDYQRVFELEREVQPDVELDQELANFRTEIERFEERLRHDELSLDDLAQIRERMRHLLPRLRSEAHGAPPQGGGSLSEETAPGYATLLAVGEELVASELDRIITALEGTDPKESAQAVVLKPQVFPLRLEPREIQAFRRLASGVGENMDLERTLLEAAALRMRMNEESDEIRGILDDTAVTGEAEVFRRADLSTRLADRYLHRFGYLLNQSVLHGDLPEAQSLQVLRMRLMRDYSGLWLLAHKHFRKASL